MRNWLLWLFVLASTPVHALTHDLNMDACFVECPRLTILVGDSVRFVSYFCEVEGCDGDGPPVFFVADDGSFRCPPTCTPTFTTPGIVRYHEEPYGATGAIVVLAALVNFRHVPGGVWSTGQAPIPILLASSYDRAVTGQIDGNYKLIKIPEGCSGVSCQETIMPGDMFGPNTYHVTGTPLAMVPNTPNSVWIGPRADQQFAIVGGTAFDTAEIFASDTDFYVYRTTFNLTALGLDPSTATIGLAWLSDNAANAQGTLFSHIRMCGIAAANDPVCPESTTVPSSRNTGVDLFSSPLTISDGFTAGLMALDFVVYNAVQADGWNPSGLNVRIDWATAGKIPGLTVSLAGSGTGTVSSDSNGISCPADCAREYALGTPVTLMASPNGASQFTGWLGARCGTSPVCSITVDADTHVIATFAQPGTVAMLDIDSSAPGSKYDALTDGVLVMRHLFGLSGVALTLDAIGIGAQRSSPEAVKSYLTDIGPALDVDGDGHADALTDGLIILRKLFGIGGEALTAGAIRFGATRSPAEIDAYLQSLMP